MNHELITCSLYPGMRTASAFLTLTVDVLQPMHTSVYVIYIYICVHVYVMYLIYASYIILVLPC